MIIRLTQLDFYACLYRVGFSKICYASLSWNPVRLNYRVEFFYVLYSFDGQGDSMIVVLVVLK